MSKTFKERVIIPGNVTGEALVTHAGFNILASFQKSLVTKSKKAMCSDQNNKNLYKKNLTGKIMYLPQTIGSTTGGLALQTAAQMGITQKLCFFPNILTRLLPPGLFWLTSG
jgi:predicted aconitase with swiveling domain